jgi:signal transduction histidine kinase
MVGAWRAVYRTEHAKLLLGRLRWCARLACLGAILLALQTTVLGGPSMQARFRFAVAYAVVSLVALGLSYWAPVREHGRNLAVGYILALVALMTDNYASLPRDAALAPAGFIALMVGVTILLPWGARPQAVVGAAALLGYGWVLAHTLEQLNPGASCLVLSMVIVAVVAAELIERYRAGSVQRAWQQEQLVSLARELAARLEPAQVSAEVLQHGLRLVEVDRATISLYDRGRRLFRVEAVTGGEPGSGSIVGLEVPEHDPAVHEIVERGTVIFPEEDLQAPLLPLCPESRVRHVLYELMRHGDELVGILTFVRKAGIPFDAGDRLLARGIADQAAVAIRTARLVTELRQASQFKSEFVSTMSHELRTPINVIMGYAEMVLDEEVGHAEHLHAARGILSAARGLRELIENTLEIGRVEAGRGEARLEAVSLSNLWSELGRGCKEMPHAPEVRLEWEMSSVPGLTVKTDPRKLTIIIHNLVSNALKFTERGCVRAEVTVEARELIFRVSDTGIGVRHEDQQAIFDMFRQADQSDTRRFGGTGLGLYLVRRFVGQLGGTTALESAVGKGSVFTVRLPREDVALQARAAA